MNTVFSEQGVSVCSTTELYMIATLLALG